MVLLPTIATAETRLAPQGQARYFDFVATSPNMDDLQFARQVLPPNGTGDGTFALAQTKVIYLNKTGVTLTPGNNDSRTNRSTIPTNSVAIPAWNTDAGTWDATVACMRELFQPFAVTVVDSRPPSGNYIQAVFGGTPQMVGLPNGVAGVSPFTTDCGIIENSIVFTFTDVIPNDARLACEIMAQEVAHSYGLDHELLASDPMTYLQYNGNRSFKNQQVSCGEDVTRPCGINGNTCRANQNSVQLLTDRLGTGGNPGDTVKPNVGITSPSNGATVPPGFDLQFTATDNVGVTMATLYVDDNAAGSLIAAPFKFTTSATLPEGQHKFRVEATDGLNLSSQEITVTIRKGALPPGAGGDDSGDIQGGCSTGGNGSFALALGLLGFALLRKRRR